MADGSTAKKVIKDLVIDYYEWTGKPIVLGAINQTTTQVLDFITRYYWFFEIAGVLLTMALGTLLAVFTWKLQHRKQNKHETKS